MELIISHYWQLPNAVHIPVLKNRLSHCFQKGLSQSVVIPSNDWAIVYGDDLPDNLVSYVIQRDDAENIPVWKIRLGSPEVFKVLQKDWYVQKKTLFVSVNISSAVLDTAVRYWLHEVELQKAHSNVS